VPPLYVPPLTVQVLTESNLSILGDMVKSLSKRAIKNQKALEGLTQDVASVKDNVDASWRMISDVASASMQTK